jgi:uncharacterized DUF497 family protein
MFMKDEFFEWDDAKAASNWRGHGVSFEMARDMFKDIFAVEWVDSGQDEHEDRFVAIGMVENRLLFVAYTMRGETIRIISARKAEPYERRRYHDENRQALESARRDDGQEGPCRSLERS